MKKINSSLLDEIGEIVPIRVITKSSANRVTVEHSAEGELLIRVYVTVVPEAGKANQEVIKLMAKTLGVPRSAVTIVGGLKSRDKLLKVKKN